MPYGTLRIAKPFIAIKKEKTNQNKTRQKKQIVSKSKSIPCGLNRF